MPPRELVVLGLDPGSTAHGWAVLLVSLAGARYHSAGHWAGSAARLVRLLHHRQRVTPADPACPPIDLVAVEVPGAVYKLSCIKQLLLTAGQAGRALGAAEGVGLAHVDVAPGVWRLAVVGSNAPHDALIKDKLPPQIVGWPARSNAHVRDAAGVALYAGRAALTGDL